MSEQSRKVDPLEFARLFGDHTTSLALLLVIADMATKLPEGDLRTGIEMAVEGGGAWLDGQDEDGRATAQILMEQVVGLLNGGYSLHEVRHGPLGVIATPTTEEAKGGEA